MNISYKSLSQLSESYETIPHEYPKYGKSTTDPTYYEPTATRIANMKKASGAQMKGIYDFYDQKDVSKMSKSEFTEYIKNSKVDPMFNNKLVREEVSQITNDLAFQAQDTVEKVTQDQKNTAKRINETVKTSEIINKNNSKTQE